MTHFVTLTYVLAPVITEVLGRAEDLIVLGDPATEVDESGVSTSRVDSSENLMGAILAQWHDDEGADPEVAREFVRSFSELPKEVRARVIEDPNHGPGVCGRYFQNDPGDSFIYDGFLLIRPTAEDIEVFFVWADRIYV